MSVQTSCFVNKDVGSKRKCVPMGKVEGRDPFVSFSKSPVVGAIGLQKICLRNESLSTKRSSQFSIIRTLRDNFRCTPYSTTSVLDTGQCINAIAMPFEHMNCDCAETKPCLPYTSDLPLIPWTKDRTFCRMNKTISDITETSYQEFPVSIIESLRYDKIVTTFALCPSMFGCNYGSNDDEQNTYVCRNLGRLANRLSEMIGLAEDNVNIVSNIVHMSNRSRNDNDVLPNIIFYIVLFGSKWDQKYPISPVQNHLNFKDSANHVSSISLFKHLTLKVNNTQSHSTAKFQPGEAECKSQSSSQVLFLKSHINNNPRFIWESESKPKIHKQPTKAKLEKRNDRIPPIASKSGYIKCQGLSKANCGARGESTSWKSTCQELSKAYCGAREASTSWKATGPPSCKLLDYSLEGWSQCLRGLLVVQLGRLSARQRLNHRLLQCLACLGAEDSSIREGRIDDRASVFVLFDMDWIRAAGSDEMISDDQLTTALQHLLVSVEKGIERLEWNGIPKPWSSASVGAIQGSSFPRCCHAGATPVDTKDSSVQTTPQEDADAPTEDKQPPCEDDIHILDGSSIQTAVDRSGNVSSVVAKRYTTTCESTATQTTLDTMGAKSTASGKSSCDLTFRFPAESVREEDPDDGYCEHVLSQPATISQVDGDLLHSQIALLPGCRDAKGRSVVFICSAAIQNSGQLSASHLAQLLLYFHTIPKKEVISKGFLVLIDAVKQSYEFWNALDEAFCLIEANISNAISDIVVLLEGSVDIDVSSLFPTSRIQFEIVSSTERLKNFIKADQLLTTYGGSYVYDHQEWISFRKFLEPFINGCRLSGRHLVDLLEELRGSRLPVSSSLTHQMIEQQKRNVSHTFRDEQLRHLEEEGDTILKELHSYSVRSPHNSDYRDNLERTNILYDELRKAMTKLARLAEKRLNRLEECLQLKTFQEESSQVLSWLCRKGNESLEKHQAVADSLGAVKQQEEEFEEFYFFAMRQIEKGNDLLEEVSVFSHEPALPKISEENLQTNNDEGGIEALAVSLRQHLGSFTEKLEGTRERIEDTAKCYQLMDKSYEWALNAMRFVSHMGIASTSSQDGINRQIRCLQDYLDNHLQIPEDTFTEMLELASRIGNEKLLEQCKIVNLRCQETVDLIHARQATLEKVRQQLELNSFRTPMWEAEDCLQTPRTTRSQSHPSNMWLPSGSSTPYSNVLGHQRRRSTGGPIGPTQRYGSPIGSYTSFPSSYYPTSKESYPMDTFMQEKEDQLLHHGFITEDLTSQGPVACISKTLLDSRMGNRDGHLSSSSSSSSSSCSKDFPSILRSSCRGGMPGDETRWSRKYTRKCQAWQIRDEALEKAKAEVREQTALLRVERLHSPQDGCSINSISETDDSSPTSESSSKSSTSQAQTERARRPVPVNTHLMTTTTPSPDVTDSNATTDESAKDTEAKSKKTLMLIMKEMIQTERDYVKSLEYIIENYIPELMREDIPQALRGQRNVVFGNIEKIYEFHYQYFLTELEHCENAPFTVGQCFLDFQPQFYLYALYNKNKPKSDALMSEYGNMFFRKKQLELQDKMDLASYLLKPVQRMGKYALLLKQLLKECPERETEHKALKAAEEMVRFQLRHGNDLLAMDALKDCDVNVKEQGRLLRQDEFIVWQGRSRKCMRHVFLFEDLILFSKARRDPQRKGYEMYQYKHSIKTTDMGMTEQIGDSPTKFEIWFRKRKLNDTFLLQAPNPEVKAAWVSELRKILVKQAVQNRENRLAEMSSMGIGNKPCLDIKPSEDQISDRSISIDQLARAPRFRNSIAVSPYDLRNNRNSIISVSSSSSSGSSQSSFSFYGTLNLGFEPGDSPRPLHRSLTQQSQCSTESGFCTDASTAGDSPVDSEQPRHKKAERSDSLLSSDSLSTNVSPTEVPCITRDEHIIEESLTTSM